MQTEESLYCFLEHFSMYATLSAHISQEATLFYEHSLQRYLSFCLALSHELYELSLLARQVLKVMMTILIWLSNTSILFACLIGWSCLPLATNSNGTNLGRCPKRAYSPLSCRFSYSLPHLVHALKKKKIIAWASLYWKRPKLTRMRMIFYIISTDGTKILT